MVANVVDELGRIPMSPYLTATLTRAADYAAAQTHREVTLEHLLLALIEDPEASVVLKTSNIDLARLTAEVSDFLGRSEDRLPPGPAGVGISQELRRILEAAAAAAQQGRRREINGAIVLAAIVGDGKSAAAHLLRTQGLTFEEAIRALQRATAAQQVQPQPRPQPPIAPPQSEPQRQMEPPRAPAADEAPPMNGRLLERRTEPVPVQQTEAAPAPEERTGPPRQSYTPSPAAEPGTQAPRPHTDYRAPAAPPPMETRPRLNDGAAAPQPSHAEPSHPSHGWTPPTQPQPQGMRPQPPPHHAPPPVGRPSMPRQLPVPNPAHPSPPPSPPQQGRYAGPPAGSAGSSAPSLPGASHPASPPPQPYGAPPPPPPGPRLGPPGSSPPWHDAGQTGQPAARAGSAPDRHRTAPGSGPFVGTWPLIEAGQLVENIPRKMRVGIPLVVEARIARSDVKALAEGLAGGGAAYRHEIVVTKAMSVRLRAPDGGFWIEPRSPETQWIESMLGLPADDYASWRWTVTARESGKRQLQLIVSARTVGGDGLTAETALPDQVIDVKVGINYSATAKRWIGWTIAAVIGGIFARFGDGAFETARVLITKLMTG